MLTFFVIDNQINQKNLRELYVRFNYNFNYKSDTVFTIIY